MPANLTIAADVIDISSDIPKLTDRFYVDTNAWFWQTYSRSGLLSSPPRYHQLTYYPTYLGLAITAKSMLFYSGYTLTELASIIERSELDIYSDTSGFDTTKTKEYRHNLPNERLNVVAEINLSWGIIKATGTFIESRVTEDFTSQIFNRLQTQLVDGYDAMILETLKRANQNQIISDDGDFATIAGLQVFTSNPNVIRLARQQGKLIVR